MNACFVFIIYLISTRDEQTGKIAEIMTDISDIGIIGKKKLEESWANGVSPIFGQKIAEIIDLLRII